jgi:hypothetical protein
MGIYHIGSDEMAMIVGPAKADVVGEDDQGTVVKIEPPTVSGLEPDSAELGSADIQLVITGTGFNELSRIVFNGFDEPTALLSPTQVRTNVKPSLFTVAEALPVCVRTGSLSSDTLDFTFTEAGGATRKRRG